MKRFSRFLPVVAGAIAGGAIALVIASGGTTHSSTTTVVEPSRGTALPTALSTGKGMTVNQIYKDDAPGVVDILVTSNGGSSGGLFGGGSQETEGEGAGVVYDKKGDIITDQHVVANATSVKVTFEDGQTASAKVLGKDPSTDVGVIHVDVPASELHPIAFTNSSAAQVGDPVVAIGSPFSLPETVTDGIVSQTGRSITAPNDYTISGAIQTDAAINPGNSGGPLLDADGQVLGLNDQIETNNSTATGEGSSSGVGFATPANEDIKVANTIIAGKPVTHPYLGVQLSSSSSGGAQIVAVTAGSPAQQIRLKDNDTITAINGRTVTSTDGFIAAIDDYAPGDTVTLSIKRDGHSMTIKAKLGTRPAQAPGTTQQIP